MTIRLAEGSEVEIDETFIGGKARTGRQGPNLAKKSVVLGMVERGGNLITRVVPNQRRVTLIPQIEAAVRKGTLIHTDHMHSYAVLGDLGYSHERVNHNAGQYVSKTGSHVQSIEGFWSQLKRGINGTHIHVSAKHLPKYLGEFEFRHNRRHRPETMLDELMMAFPR